MRYFTKEFYQPTIRQMIFEGLEPIEDKEYSDEDIEELYKVNEELFVDLMEDFYNTSPVKFREERLDNLGIDIEDITIWDLDEDGNRIRERSPEDVEEFREYLAKDLTDEIEEFENREPFTREEFKEYYRNFYQSNLEEGFSYLPEYVQDKVDPRILAMNLIPDHLHNKLLEELEMDLERQDEEFDKYLDLIEEETRDIPEDIMDPFFLSNSVLYRLEEVEDEEEGGETIELGLMGENIDGYEVDRMIILEDAYFIELEELDYESEDFTEFLNFEIHEADGGYELHMIFLNDLDLKYVTIFFTDLFYDDIPLD